VHGIDGGTFLVMYSGNMGLTQRLEAVLGAAELLRDHPQVQFALVGDGAMRSGLERTVAQRRLLNVQFYGYQPRRLLAHSLSAADLQIVFMAPGLQACLMPSKTYSVLAAGVPILAMADETSELAWMVDSEDVGVVCNSHEPTELVRAILDLAKDCSALAAGGCRARKLAVARFDRQFAITRFVSLLASCNINGDGKRQRLRGTDDGPLKADATAPNVGAH
jgi:glycosyltransferase involved in cell wall biosynthesis